MVLDLKRLIQMFKWLGDVAKKVLVNLITLLIVGFLFYYFVLRKILPF